MTRCGECVRCSADDCDATAFCLSDRPDTYPCPHGERLCEEHALTGCRDCNHIAELNIWATQCGTPHDVGPGHRLDVAAWMAEVDASAAERDFDPRTNSKRRKP